MNSGHTQSAMNFDEDVLAGNQIMKNSHSNFKPSRPNKYLPSEQEAFNIYLLYAKIEWITQ